MLAYCIHVLKVASIDGLMPFLVACRCTSFIVNLLFCYVLGKYISLSLSLYQVMVTVSHTHTHTFNGPFSGTTQVSRYHKGKTNLDFTEARDSEWQ